MTKTVDPFAGSYVVESLTDDLEAATSSLMQAVEDRGGAVAAIEQGFQKDEIERSAYRIAQEIDSGERVVVGVNRFTVDERGAVRAAAGRPGDRGRPARARWRACAPPGRRRRRAGARRAADGGRGQRQRPLPDARGARAREATVGEVCHALREVWGTYVPARRF